MCFSAFNFHGEALVMCSVCTCFKAGYGGLRPESHSWCLIAVCTLLKVQNITLDHHDVNIKGVRS